MNDLDPIDLLARELPPLDVTPARAEAIRARAHLALAHSQPGWRRRLKRVYRGGELGLVGLIAIVYAAWAFQSVLLMQR